MADTIAVMNRRRDRAVRAAAGDLRPAGEPVRRRFHRLAADELPRVRGRPRAAATRGAHRGRDAVGARAAGRSRRRRRSSSASDPSMCASPTTAGFAARSSAPNISARRRSSPSNRPRPGARAAARRRRFERGETVGLALRSRTSSSLFDGASGRAIRTALHEGGARMAEVVARPRLQALRRRRGGRDLSLTIADGEFVVLLGPTGAGKTTTLRLVAGLERPDAGTIRIGGPTSRAPTRPCATSPSSSSNTRSIRI